MPGAYACCTIFFHIVPGDLVELYEEIAEPANGYLTRLDGCYALVDAQAGETADWARQTNLATMLSGDDGVGISVFMIGTVWALAIAGGGQPGPVAVFDPDDEKLLQQLPQQLLRLETRLVEFFPERVDPDELDRLLGAMLDGGITAEEGITAILVMLGCPDDWLRWSWYETIPEQLFIDPDLSARVTPLGEARELWEE